MVRWLSALLVLPALAGAQTSLELSDCRISAGDWAPGMNARCGLIERPLDPDNPDGETITLKVAVVPALDLDPLPDPVVPVAGGPGQGTIGMYAAQRQAFEPLRRDRDILLIDQRGTGESTLLGCPAADEDLIEGEFSAEQTEALARDCLAQLEFDPRYFTTSVAVRDIDAVREALGYPEINIYGVSYGSRVAQHYARRYPEHTRTVIIDGVVPPQLPLGPDIALESQRALDQLFARCSEDAACVEAFPDLASDFDGVMARLKAEPVELVIQNPVSGRLEDFSFNHHQFAVAIRLMLYDPSMSALLPLMVTQAAQGHYQPIANAMRMTTGSLQQSLAVGMHNAVMCTEDTPFYSSDNIDIEAISDAYLGREQLDALQAICRAWPAGVIDEDLRTPLATELPVLLLSGSADPITPPAYAELAMQGLGNARHIVGDRQGHGQLGVGCMPELLAEFVASADPAAPDAECFHKRSHVMPFFTDFTGPMP